jgi:5'-nucleotidase
MIVVAVDVDDVIADSVPELLRRYNADYNDSLKPEDITAWDLTKFVKPECGTEIYKYFDEPDFYSRVFPIDGAVRGVTLLQMNHRVVFVTAPLAGSSAKKRWLEKLGLLNNDRNYVESKDKSLIFADVLIDDGIHNLMGFRGDRIIYNQPWNAEGFVQSAFRARGWIDVVDFVRIINDHHHPQLQWRGQRQWHG